MNRRQFLAVNSVYLLGMLAGCSSEDESEEDQNVENWSPEIQATEPELEPGDEGSIIIEATEIAGFTFSTLPDPNRIDLYNDIEWSPRQDSAADTRPQHWYWDTRTDVEGELPVIVPDDAASGEYTFEVEVFADDHPDSETRTEEFSLTIVDP